MNAPSNGGLGHGSEGPSGNWRNKMDQWRQQAAAERRDYEPLIHNQIERQFQEYSPPIYASMIGWKRDWNLMVAQSRITGFAATLQRDFTDEETKALVEHTLKNIHTNAEWRWTSVGIAGYMTYRGRHTWQFPFYKPKFNSKFNPNEATSLFSSKKIRGFYPNLIWHTMRFTAYTAVVMLMVEPALRAVNHLLTEQDMMKDPRLAQFTKDAAVRVEQVMKNGPMGGYVREQIEKRVQEDPNAEPQETRDTGRIGAWNPAQEDRNAHVFGPDSQDTQPAPQESWARASPSSSYRTDKPLPAQQSSRDENWSVLDDEDDASPVSTPRQTQSSNPRGSAWDRLRRQGQPTQQQPTSESAGSWGSQTQQSWPQTQDGWGGSTEDQDKAVAKEQAQAEFDRMLERERSGNGQGGSWRR
ncbi:Fc.00g060600.m01.CDS01 [Cosmosporella sp. VM-42]